MRQTDTLVLMTDEDFAEYEKKRMYPPWYGKERPMTKMTMHHISAIAHAELFLEPAIEKAPEVRFANQLTKDLERLSEIKAFLIEVITNPKLPFEKHDGI